MRKKIVILASFLFIVFNISFAYAETITVAIDPNLPPFTFIKDGDLTGFDVELLNNIAANINKKLKFVPMDFNLIISAVASGITDLGAGGCSISDERRKIVDFSEPYFDSGLIIVTRKDMGELDINKIQNKKVGTYVSDFSKYFVQVTKLDKNIIYGKFDFLFNELLSGSIDAIFVDYPLGKYVVSHDYKDSLKLTGPLYFPHQYGFAMRKNYYLKTAINKAIKSILLSPTYKKLYFKYFGD
jgi:glutamine transport system substrate-binding protein